MSAGIDKAVEGSSPSLVYSLQPTSKKFILDRKTIFRDPVGKNKFKNGETAQLTLDGDDFVDPHTVYAKGRLRALASDGTTALGATILPRLYGGAVKTIKQIKISSRDGKEIEKIEAFNVLTDVLNNCCLSEDYLKANGQSELLDAFRADSAATTKVGALAAGEHYKVRSDANLTVAGAVANDENEDLLMANRIVAAAANVIASGDAIASGAGGGTLGVAAVARGDCFVDKLLPPKYETKEATDWIKDGADFIIPLFKYVGFLKQGKLLPMKYLGALKMEIEFISNPLEALKCAADPGANISIVIDNLKLVYDTVRINDVLQSSIEQEIMNNPDGMPMDFQTYYHVTKDNTGDSNVTLTFDKGATDCLSVYTVIRPQAIAYNTEALEFKGYGAGGAFAKWQYRLGSATFPVSQVDTYPQARAELDKAMGHFGDSNRVNLSRYEFENKKYVMAVDLENDPSSHYTGRSTNSGSQLNLAVEGLDTAVAKRFDGFLLHTKVVRIKPNYNTDLYE